MGVIVGNTVYVDEPATNVKFQKLLRLSEFPYSLLLIGTGFREVFSLNYKFYAAAFYMNPLILDNLEPWKGRSAAEIQRDSSLFGFIYQAPLEKSLKIVPVLDISGEMCWDVLVGAVFRRFKSPTSSVDFIALSTFHDILTNCSLKKGCSIFLTWPQPSKLLLHLSAEGIPSAAVATIQSESVAHCLFDVFFGRGPVSPSLKASVSKGIASILK
ncbi:hypothetical protein OSB04_un000009 [Centaurea solstitialis]|uniref:Chalcone-flavonone isomerase family protein n=1 Tax=Centaurea solstitialis TaxID=347529 RepID=A0AA38SIH3_9ASTR|nr:hypothetical protein OSB04_un000009 [Centaurea solstitialis]